MSFTKDRRMAPAIILACEGIDIAALNVTRALGEHGVPIIIISESKHSASAHSKYCIDHWVVPNFSADPAGVARALNAIGEKYRTAMPVFPTADPDLFALTELGNNLGPYVKSTLGDSNINHSLMDKNKFDALAIEYGLPVPRTWLPYNQTDIAQIAREARFPLIAKPPYTFNSRPALQKAFLGKKAVLLRDAEALIEFCRPLGNDAIGVIIQTYVAGPDDHHYVVDIYVNHNLETKATFTGRKLRIFPAGAGFGCFIEAVKEPELEQHTAEYLQRIGFRGIANVDYKRDMNSGEFFMFEVNARSSHWSIFSTRCGINLPWLAYCDTLGLECGNIPQRQYSRFFLDISHDLRAARQYAKQGELKLRDYLSSIFQRNLVYQGFSIRDPRPTLYLTIKAIGDVGNKLKRKINIF